LIDRKRGNLAKDFPFLFLQPFPQLCGLFVEFRVEILS
jgi:hypothetical protein